MGNSNAGFVAYYRVSTKGQGESGLGLEAQRQAVAAYINGSGNALLAEYTEVESGKRGTSGPSLEQRGPPPRKRKPSW